MCIHSLHLFSVIISVHVCVYTHEIIFISIVAECAEQTADQEWQGCEWRWNGWQWCLCRRWYY